MIKKLFQKPKNALIALSASSLPSLIPVAYAADEATNSPPVVLELIQELLGVFQAAGLVLLVYAIIAFVLALKNEDAESKVNAITQLSIAIVLLTLSTTVSELMTAAGLSNNLT